MTPPTRGVTVRAPNPAASLQRRHRIGNAAGSVQPTFQRGDAKVEIETGQGMPPDLGGERRQGCVQGTGFRWRG